MLGIGIGEMVLIAGIALVVIGPEKFPDFAKIALRTVRDLRGYVDDIKEEVTKEMRPVRDELNTLTRYEPEALIDGLTGGGAKEKSGTQSGDEDYDTEYGEEGYPHAGESTDDDFGSGEDGVASDETLSADEAPPQEPATTDGETTTDEPSDAFPNEDPDADFEELDRLDG